MKYAERCMKPATARPPEECFITRHELVQSARLLGERYEFEGYLPDEHEPLLDGAFHTRTLQPGLILHAAQTRDRYNLCTRNVQMHPGVKLVVVVDGSTEFAYGPQRFVLGPQGESLAGRTQGILLNLLERDTFSRRWQRGRRERKVSLTLTREWLVANGLVGSTEVAHFLQNHLSDRPWLLTARAIELCHQIVQLGTPTTGLDSLRLQACCLNLVVEAFGSAFPEREHHDGLRSLDRQRLAQLDELLHTAQAKDLSTPELARQVGSNPTSLQALAHRVWGCTLADRARAIRLDRARDSLRQGENIAQVASEAGYGAPSNFSTAFKRHFGITPRQAQQRSGR